ncbi:MAG: magnesium-translocating P-type ATPase [Planctomycetes bacterium]|jgi:Mg2+-importing ATPase|nr:magnesium-translocating P-type ATPase [Planctomycetota bacterium]
MDIFSYADKSSEETLKNLQTEREKGLTGEEAVRRLSQYGPNEIADKSVYWWHILWRQFKSPFIYLLLAAALLAIILRELIDGLMIVIFVLINVVIGFYQEFRSEQVLKLLKQYVVSTVKVRRGGEEKTIPARELVPGDLVMLVTGDMIPADIRLVESYNLTIDESILTGESAAVNKTSQAAGRAAVDIFTAPNLGFSGTTVVRGKGTGLVLATGSNSEIGRISGLTAEARHVGSFEKGITHFSKFIIRLVLSTLLFIYIANIFLKGGQADALNLLIFSIALAISVIPEALPLVITFSLSRGALRLARKKVVVRRLSAIEDLGCIEVLCTDKTGTITENKLTLSGIYPAGGREALKQAFLAAAPDQGSLRPYEPFDAAVSDALTAEEKKGLAVYERLADIPFDPVRRRNSVLVKQPDGSRLIMRGAPEELLSLCGQLKEDEKEKINSWIARQGKAGCRILAVADKPAGQAGAEDLEALEKDLRFTGVLSFVDPIKETTQAAVAQAQGLGVAIKIITGDSREVAGAVAVKIGLIPSEEEVITGLEFAALAAEKQAEAAKRYAVFARITPAQKYRIIELLEREHEVGFLGEGINDTPALKIANVSLVVQSAADIAREVADIVLLQKNLKVIIDGIRDGRSVFANTTKYIKITLASNFGNFYAVAIASLIIMFLPMLPIQILLLNLLSDFPMIAIAADTVDAKELARPRKYNIKDIIIIATVLGIVSSFFDFIFFGLFYRISPAVLQTNWFIGSILTELALIYSLRTHLPFYKAKFPSRSLFWLSVLAAAVTIALPFSRFGQEAFRFTPPSLDQLFLIFGIVAAYFLVTEVVKLFYYRTAGKNLSE